MAAKALNFVVGDYVVYPKHGVGRVVELQSQEIAGAKLELYVLRFEKERMTLRVPTNKAEAVGMRKLSSSVTLQEAQLLALATEKGKLTVALRNPDDVRVTEGISDLSSTALSDVQTRGVVQGVRKTGPVKIEGGER